MHYGIDLPTSGDFGDVRVLAALAREAEEAGWDGFFVFDQVALEQPDRLVDPWIALTAIALATRRIRFGPLVTPLARRRPWVVARQTVTLDHLSGGRLVLGIGLGNARQEFDDLGEASHLATRASMLDEGLEVLTRLWRGEPFSYRGGHYTVRDAHFLPRPVQSPRIPIWVGGTWPIRAPFRRAARWDGVFPHFAGTGSGDGAMMPPDAVRDMVAYVARYREGAAPFDVIIRNKAPSGDPARDAAWVDAYAQAGLTWWLEGVEGRNTVDAVRRRIGQGPPSRPRG